MNGVVLAVVWASFAPGQIRQDIVSAPYRIEPPEIIRIEASMPAAQDNEYGTIRRKLLVRPDGTVGLPPFGAVLVEGLTADEAAGKIRAWLATKFECPSEKISVRVGVVTYRKPHAWIITHLSGQDETVYARWLTGSETVVDVVASIDGLPAAVGNKCRMWLERQAGGQAGRAEILAVDWKDIVQKGNVATNYSLRDGDRVHVSANPPRPEIRPWPPNSWTALLELLRRQLEQP